MVAENDGFVRAESFDDLCAFVFFEGDATVVETDAVVVVEAGMCQIWYFSKEAVLPCLPACVLVNRIELDA